MADSGAITTGLDGIDERIREFICAELDYAPEEVGYDTLLFSTGLVDSFTFVGVVALIEISIGRPLDPRGITVENFDSISRIVEFLHREGDPDPSARLHPWMNTDV
jgi:acyl carrier protein